MSTQNDWNQLVSIASRNVKAARLLDADWPEGTLEDADVALDAALAGQVVPPPGPPPPDPTTILGYYGTYSGHGFAEDCYLGFTPEQASWGPHHGIDVLAPQPGRVEVYQFGTPLNLPQMADPAYAARHAALFDGWTCMAPPPRGVAGPLVGGQIMFVAVYWPDGGITLDDGSHATGLGFGHVRGDVVVGRVDAGGRICTIWDSGIRFEANGITARAAHVHLTIFRSTTLSPNGDVDGRLALGALGWQAQRLGSVPGPTDYMGGAFLAGRPKKDWTGHEIPPVPS